MEMNLSCLIYANFVNVSYIEKIEFGNRYENANSTKKQEHGSTNKIIFNVKFVSVTNETNKTRSARS